MKINKPLKILPKLQKLITSLHSNQNPEIIFSCFKQLIEENIDLVLQQLNSRWLVSVCDIYVDFGDEIESRNAMLISNFINWERIVATFIDCNGSKQQTRQVEKNIPKNHRLLWDGLVTIHLSRGDTTNNLLKRYSRLLKVTPVLYAIWKQLLQHIRDSDSILAALNNPHGYLFDENTEWMKKDEYKESIPSWKR